VGRLCRVRHAQLQLAVGLQATQLLAVVQVGSRPGGEVQPRLCALRLPAALEQLRPKRASPVPAANITIGRRGSFGKAKRGRRMTLIEMGPRGPRARKLDAVPSRVAARETSLARWRSAGGRA